MKALRWLVLVPAACLAGAAGALVAGLALAMGNGMKFTGDLMAAPDMAGSYLTGTYCVLIVRGAMGAASTYAATAVAPTHKRITGLVWFGILSVGMFGTLAMLIVLNHQRHLGITFGEAWRYAVELIGTLGGSWIIMTHSKDRKASDAPEAEDQ